MLSWRSGGRNSRGYASHKSPEAVVDRTVPYGRYRSTAPQLHSLTVIRPVSFEAGLFGLAFSIGRL